MSDSPPPPATDAAPRAASVPATSDDDNIIDLSPRRPDDYDPADYRWVPVRRRPRHDGWTEEKQRRFIEVLADTGQVGLAAREVGMTRETAYRLRRSAHGAHLPVPGTRRAIMPGHCWRISRSNARSRASSAMSMTGTAKSSPPGACTTTGC